MSQAYSRLHQTQSEIGLARDLLVNPSLENLADCREHLERAVAGLHDLVASGKRLDSALRAPLLHLQRDLKQTAALLHAAETWNQQRSNLLAEPPGGGYTPTGVPPRSAAASSLSVRG